MKAIALLISLCFVFNTLAGLPPTTLGGLKSSSKPTTFNFKAPNNQATPITGGGLIETGNLNLLSNPGFEHLTYDTNWTSSGSATRSAETVALISGNKAYKAVMAGNANDFYQDSTLYAAQLAGMQGYVQISCSNTAPGATVCARAAGVKSTTDCVTMATDGLWHPYEIGVVLSATSNGIEVSTGTTAGTLICDDAYVGLISGKTPEVAQAQLAGRSYYLGNASCTWARASTTMGAFTAEANCVAPVIDTQRIGTWSTTDANLPQQTIDNLPVGDYVMVVEGYSAPSTTNLSSLALSDGTKTCTAQGQITTTDGSAFSLSCPFTLTSPGSKTFAVHGQASTGSARIGGSTATGGDRSLTFTLYYYPPASKIYSQNNNNGETTFTGSGSWVTNTTYTASYKFLPDGFVEYKYLWATSGAPTSANLTLNLPSGHIIDTSRLPRGAGNQMVFGLGDIFDAAPARYSAFAYFDSSSLTSITAYPEGSAGTYGTYNGPVTQAVPMTWASGDSGTLTFRIPITIWKGSMITGTFAEMMKVVGQSRPVFASASVDASEVITENESNFITSCTNADPSICTLATSFFTADPKCWANPTSAGTIATVTLDTTTSVTIDRTDASTPFKLFCQGNR